MDKQVYYFSGTHWDREWYQTFQGFRYRLVKMMDGLLDTMEQDKDFGVFHLDGQTIVLEDYAEIEPERAEKLKKYIAENRIKIGPWYVMPDEFLLSGESLIRNLMIGHRLAKKWGADKAWKFGYICDIFGHIAQTPQIFNGFGIEYSLFSRGYFADSCPYFIWQSPDGSSCINFRMGNKCGYGEFCVLVLSKKRGIDIYSPEELAPRIKEYMDYLQTTSDIPVYVVMDALDHTPVHRDTMKYIEMIKEAVPDAKVHHCDLLEAGRELEKYRGSLDVIEGEMNRTNKGGFPDVITNTLSSYYTIKKANDECQNALEKVVEPMLALASMKNRAQNRKFLQLAYKYLIQNHPHDSICGCSIDQVHKDVEYRFDQTKEICDVLALDYMINNTRPFLDPEGIETDGVLTLVNTLPFDREEVITARLNMRSDFAAKFSDQPFGFEFMNRFKLFDAAGGEIPYTITKIERSQTVTIKDQATQVCDVYSIVFKAFVPAGGRSEYRICEAETPVRYLKHMKSGADYMENDHVRIDIAPNGTIALFDKKTGHRYENQLGLIDDSEIGDGWYHADARENKTVYSGFESARVEKIETGCARCVFRITKTLSLPEQLIIDTAGQRRSDKYVDCTAVFEVALAENARFADVKLTFDNRAKDHRLRLCVPTYSPSDEYFAGQAFYCCKRKCGIDYRTQNWREYEQYEKAMNGIAGKRRADGSGLAFVSAAGLHECGSFANENDTLCVTLLRSFRKTVQTNGEIRGQLLGEQTYRFILAPLDADVHYADLVKLADRLGAPMYERYAEIEKNDRLMPPEEGFKLCGRDICLSILKCAEDEEHAYVARVFNASDKADRAVMIFPFAPSEAVRVNLNEEQTDAPAPELCENTVSVDVAPWQIVTVKVRQKGEGIG